MGKQIIVRVAEGTNIPPKVIETLQSLLPGFQIEYFKNKPDYKESIKRRIDSLYDAFIFLIDAYPPDPETSPLSSITLRKYALESKTECNLNKSSLEELHKELEQFTARLVEAIYVAWPAQKDKLAKDALKEAIASLNEAEQYMLMSKPRPDLATLMPMKFAASSTDYVLQWDQSLSPCYHQFNQELNIIAAESYPVTPSWYRALPLYQQTYFLKLDANIAANGTQAILSNFQTFKTQWAFTIKPNSLYINEELRAISNEIKPFPVWYENLNEHTKELIKGLAAVPSLIENSLDSFERFLIEKLRKKEFKNTVALISKIPEWYWVLSHREQRFFRHALKTAPSINEAVLFLSSRHRTLPVPANFAVHSVYRLNNNGEIQLLGAKRYRSSHIASRDILECSKSVQMRHATSNFAKVTEQAQQGQYILMQTLISPIFGSDYVPKFVTELLPELPPDIDLYNLAVEAVERNNRTRMILKHNHPFNIAKYVFATQANSSDSANLIKAASSVANLKPALQELIADYTTVLKSGVGSATVFDYDGRELFLSSIEQLIIFGMSGFSYGSCVSAKDRKAIELMHTDAMLLYKEKYGVWPKFGLPTEKEERINFVAIVVDVYLTWHQHVHAGQNAPGSDGIKTVYWYFPNDIADAINERFSVMGIENGLANDDRLATDNEVGKITKDIKSYFFKEHELLCTLMSKQIGEEGCNRLYDSLVPLLGENSQFKKQVSAGDSSINLGLFGVHARDGGKIPTGIKDIKKIISSRESGDTNIERLTTIFIKVLSRPEVDKTRTRATNSVYNCIRALLKPCESGTNQADLVNQAIKEWDSLFEESKVTNGVNFDSAVLV
ncbi:MAG: oxidoreductase [Legionella sp.]|jgi:hypothetical protein